MSADESEVERAMNYLKNKTISEEPEKYAVVLSKIHKHPQKIEILKKIFAKVDNSTVFLALASSFFASMEIEGKESCGVSSLAVLSFSKDLCSESRCDYDLLCKVAFSYLEKTRFRFLEVKSELFKIFDQIAENNVQISAHSLGFLQTEQPPHVLSEVLTFIGGEVLQEVMRYVIEEGGRSRSSSLHKNTGLLIVSVLTEIDGKESIPMAEIALRAMQSEVQTIRNSGIEGAGKVAERLKKEIEEKEKGEKELKTLTEAICRRTRDVSPFCRSKAVQVLGEMSERSAVLREQKKKMLEMVVERILDKTHIVRKKAISFFKKILETHPFELDGGMLSQSVVEKCRKIEDEYHTECAEFCDIVQKSIEGVKEILKTGIRGEVAEIIQYVSVCTSYEIPGAIEVFPDLFALAWTRGCAEGKSPVDTLAEEIQRMSDGDPKKLLKFMVHFDSPSLSYEGLVRELTLRGILGPRVINEIVSQIEKRTEKSDSASGRNILPYLKMLRKITTTDKSATDQRVEKVIQQVSHSSDVEVLSQIVGILGNLDYRVPNSSEVVILLKTLLEDRVHERELELLQRIIDTSYLISTHPDALAVEILRVLCRKNSVAPLLFSVGHIALKEAVHLERVEAAWSVRGKHAKTEEDAKKPKIEPATSKEIRERRLSVGSRRASTKATTEEQEELADKVFFAKEHEILFGEDSALRPFVNLVREHIYSEDAEIRKVALVSLGKMMGISSEYNTKHMEHVIRTLCEGSDELKVICLMIISDSVMAFSSLIGTTSKMLFSPLDGNCSPHVKLTALALIRHLLRAGMIKIKEKYRDLSLLLLPAEREEVRTAALGLFEEAMQRESPSRIICEVIKSHSRRTGNYLREDSARCVNLDEHSSEVENIEEMGRCRSENATRADGGVREDEEFLEIFRALAKISGGADLSKKIQDWGASKKDEAHKHLCDLAVSELVKSTRGQEMVE